MCVAAALCSPAPAGAPLGATPIAAQVSFGGCYVNGGMIPSVPDASLHDIAMARVDPRFGPLIIYNPYVVATSVPTVQLFFYYHECAHHVLGHTIGAGHPLVNEQAADCWAVQQLVARQIFGPAQVQQVQQWIAVAAPGDWTHLPGPIRSINLYHCLGW